MKANSKKKQNNQDLNQDALVRKIPMRTLEILIIGAPNSGKSSLAQSLLGVTEIETQSYGIGMTLHKAKINLPSGETVMLYLWDAKTSMTFKEAHELAEIDEKSKGALAFGATKPKDYTAPSESLIQDYLRTGTYHSVLFVFDPSLVQVDKVFSRCSFTQMERWFDLYKSLCVKSWQGASICFVANNHQKKEGLQNGDYLKNLIEEEKKNAFTEGKKLEKGIIIEEPLQTHIPDAIMQEWINALTKEAQEEEIKKAEAEDYTPPVRQERFKREFHYVQIDTFQGRGIPQVKKWAIQQALKRYKHIEKKRYKTIEYVKAPEMELPGPAKERKLCGERGCLIF